MRRVGVVSALAAMGVGAALSLGCGGVGDVAYGASGGSGGGNAAGAPCEVAQPLSAEARIGTCGGTSDPTFSGLTVCTSGTYYEASGDDGSSIMAPGQACVSCHDSRGKAPRLILGGTVYPTGHEPDNCNGTNTKDSVAFATVVITDANGTTWPPVDVNRVGNFYRKGDPATVAWPIRAKVVYDDGTERAMGTPQTSGDCNSCHTTAGAADDAPGRIALPR